MNLRYVCMDCGARKADAGNCGSCKDSPLLDLNDPEVRIGLKDDDLRRASKRDRLFIALSVPFAIVAVVIAVNLPGLGLLMDTVPGGGLKYLVLMAGAGYGLSRLLLKLFPEKQRFPFINDLNELTR
jgi:hypothetical protein